MYRHPFITHPIQSSYALVRRSPVWVLTYDPTLLPLYRYAAA
eukprot:SAG31_NODE_17243_length_678_cov_0.877375_1_plen_41_part_10